MFEGAPVRAEVMADQATLTVLDGRHAGATIRAADCTWLVPCEPTKIICMASNYRAHAAEMGKPVPTVPLIFMKPSTAIGAHGGVIELPPDSHQVDYEGELALVIGSRARHVGEAEAYGVIAGFTVLNDVTARDIQRAEQNRFTRAKGFDTFAPCGPSLVDEATLRAGGLDPQDLGIVTRVNGEVRQNGRTSDMVFDIRTIVAFVSRVMTLLPGDVIATGTPAGVGSLADGDVVSIAIEGVGELTSHVRASGSAR